MSLIFTSKYAMRLSVVVFILTIKWCDAQNSKEELLSSWYLETQGITLDKNTSLTLGYYEYQSIQLTTIEISVLLKINITDKLSALGGTTFDFYRTRQGISSDFSVYGTMGLQYNINTNSFIQGVFSVPIKSSMDNMNYNMGTQPSFMLRSKFKF